MRHWRTAIVVLGVLGLLVQAGLVARHSPSVVANHFLDVTLSKPLGVMCGHNVAGATAAHEVPQQRPPSDGTHSVDCPICQGLLSAVATLPVHLLVTPALDQASVRLERISEFILHRIASERPPSTGPPTAA